jgi:hypothetical protein
MKYPVIKRFTCKLDSRRYKPGDTYETSDPERAAFLIDMGRIGPAAEAPPDEPIHVGGGWYQLADGRKVRKSELPGGE